MRNKNNQIIIIIINMNKERRTFHKTEQKEKKTYICFRHMKSSRALKKKRRKI